MRNLMTLNFVALALGLSALAALADATFTLQDLSHKTTNDNMMRAGADQSLLSPASLEMLSQKTAASALMSPGKAPQLSGFDAIKFAKTVQSAQTPGSFNLEITRSTVLGSKGNITK